MCEVEKTFDLPKYFMEKDNAYSTTLYLTQQVLGFRFYLIC